MKLIDLPESNYVVAVGLALGAVALLWWALTWRPRHLERAPEPAPHALD